MANLTPIESLGDAEVLSLSDLQMDPDQDARLSELRERSLLSNEPQELEGLMQIYSRGFAAENCCLS